jgi:hypothetical protein
VLWAIGGARLDQQPIALEIGFLQLDELEGLGELLAYLAELDLEIDRACPSALALREAGIVLATKLGDLRPAIPVRRAPRPSHGDSISIGSAQCSRNRI